MNLFCIIAYDDIGSDTKRALHSEEHILHLRALNQQGRLHAAGPLMNDEKTQALGSLLVVEFPTQAEAEQWFKQDNYYQSGVYKTVTVYPYIDGLPLC